MLNRLSLERPAAAVLATCLGFAGTTAFAPAASSQGADAPAGATDAAADAERLFREGTQRFAAGDEAAARDLLRRVDPMLLPREQRRDLYATLARLDGAGPAPTEAAATGEAPEARRLLDEAAAALRAGDLDTAESRLIGARERVQAGAELSWFDQQRLESQLGVVAERRAQLAASSAADADRVGAAADPAAAPAEAGSSPEELAAERERLAAAAAAAEQARADALAAATASEEARRRLEEQRSQLAQNQAQAQAQPVAGRAVTRRGTDPATADLLLEARRSYAADLASDADAALSNGYRDLAVTLYEEAAQLDPQNEAIQARLAAALRQRTQRAAADSPIEQQVQLDRLQLQAASASFEASMNEARAAADAGNFAVASDAVARAKSTLERNQGLYAPEAFRARRAAATELSVSINERQRVADLQQREIDAANQAELDAANLERATMSQRRQVDQLINEARKLQTQTRYDEALKVIEEALFIDPQNIAAQAVQSMLEDLSVISDQAFFKRQHRVMLGKQAALNVEATIPYDDLLVYPSDWPELTQRRLEALDSSGGESRANRETAQRLEAVVPIDFQANPLESIIDFLRTTTGANFFVNWPALALSRIEKDQPITLTLNDVPASVALERVLQLANSGADARDVEQAQYSIIDGVVEITTRAELTETTEARVYSIRDILFQAPNFTDAPEFDLGSALEGSGGEGGGGGGGSIFGDTQDEEDEEDAAELREELIANITEIIQSSVGTLDEWLDGVSTLQELNGNLIVKTTNENHRAIIGVLGGLRELRSTQISVEARFLLVDNNFIENFNVDLDFTIPGQTIGSGTIAPFRVEQDSISVADRGTTSLTPGRFIGEDGSSLPQSLAFGLSFIDDLQVDLLVQATLANQKSIQLTAPRVTFFDGQRAYVLVANQVAFISDLEPVEDAVGFDVTVDYVNSGVVLDVEGVVSADRRYVTMTLRPSLATLEQPFRQIEITGGALIGEGLDDGDDEDGPDLFIPISGTVELPELQLTTVRTTVSVPDQGTLLVGGQRLVNEIEVEVGVPILSKLPIVNRLFTNTSTSKDERTLLILIKPTVILQGEQEDILFPGLNENPAKYNVGNNLN